jgi:hypothetical protein
VPEGHRPGHPPTEWTRRQIILGLGGALLGGAALAESACGPLQSPGADQAAQGSPELQFDRERAWAHVMAQVDAGPRVSNTPGHAAIRAYLQQQLGALTSSVLTQDFSFDAGGTLLNMSNVIGLFGPRTGPQVILAAHWDTRPWADQDRNPANRQQPIPGANDGASGVAVLLEVARVLNAVPPPVGVWIVFFDGEDYGPGIDAMFLGSRHYAQNLVPGRPDWGILLDMVGDRDLRIEREGYSQQLAAAVNDRVWNAARALGRTEFVDVVGAPVLDDHVALLQIGVPMIDLIDFSYGPGHSWWHTLEDTPDKLSTTSLEAVGQVVLRTIYTAA